MNLEERKALARRYGLGWEHEVFTVCEKYYPKCCQYHEGFDDALADLLEETGWRAHRRMAGDYPVYGRVHDKNSVHMDGCIPLYAIAPPREAS